MLAMFVAPIALVGPPLYPFTEWRRALMWAGVGPSAGFTVHQLVREINQLLTTLHGVARTDALTGFPTAGHGTKSCPASYRARSDQESGCPLHSSTSTTSRGSTTIEVIRLAINC